MVPNLKPAKFMVVEYQGAFLTPEGADGRLALIGFDREVNPDLQIK